MNNPPNAPGPFRPEVGPGVPAGQLKACPKCGRWIDPNQALYNDQGELVCNGCSAQETVSKGYLRAADGAAHSAVGMGVLSIFCNPLFIFSILAVSSAISALVMLNRQEYIDALGQKRTWLIIEAVLGLIAGLIRPAMFVMALLGLIVSQV